MTVLTTLAQISDELDNIAVTVLATLPGGETIELHHGNVRREPGGITVQSGGAWVRPTQIVAVPREIGDKDYLYGK